MASKRYRVEFQYIEADGSVRADKMTVPLSTSSGYKRIEVEGRLLETKELEGPWIVEGKPYEGELSDEDLARLRMRPGKEFSAAWRFEVTAL